MLICVYELYRRNRRKMQIHESKQTVLYIILLDTY